MTVKSTPMATSMAASSLFSTAVIPGGIRPLFRENAAFQRDLQHAHDTPSGGDDWLLHCKKEMRDLARNYHLNDAVLSERP
jgi:hypothetical protein